MARRREPQLGISLVFALVIVSSMCIGSQAQQIDGFVSIDCGSSTPYNDSVLKFLWETDWDYVYPGANAKVTANVSASDNSQALQTFRYFPETQSKFCYELPAPINSTFLIRAMFLHGGSTLLTLPIKFDLYVNGSKLSTVEYGIYATSDTLNTPIVVEGIFPCPGSMVYICLVPIDGVPFISSLEYRQLDPDGIMYSTEWGNTAWLFYLMRYNCGVSQNSSTVRYPDDKFDRLWLAPGDWADGLQAFANSTSTLAQTSSPDVNYVPPKVMEAAWLKDTGHSSIVLTIPIVVDSDYVYAAVYTEEIQPQDSGKREFDIDANGLTLESYVTPTSTAPALATSSYVVIDANVLNFTLETTSASLLGPIANALEAFIVNDFYNYDTRAQDVDALEDLQVNFNLTGWQGDPCEPVAWDWIVCTTDEYKDDNSNSYYVARVNQILLSNKGIHGTIPASISQLEALTEIHLDNNYLNGSIPDSLASIQNLTLLLLNNNNLSGEIPQALATKLGSNFSYSGNKQLGGFSPTSSPSGLPSPSPSGLNPKSPIGLPSPSPTSFLSPSPTGLPTSPPSPPTSTNKKKSNNTGVLIGAVAGGVVGLGAVLSILIWCCCFRTKANKSNKDDKKEVSLAGSFAGYVSYEAVRNATGGFKDEIGKGSYGSVYRGWLNNQEVAIKLRNMKSDQGLEEFMNEVKILTRVHHRNLVSLIGYCNEGKELILIYEYQVHGTLREWLYGEDNRRGSLDWAQRLQVAADGAKGLEYLHKGCKPSIIHRDVKSSNILLDDTLTAKVADFGL